MEDKYAALRLKNQLCFPLYVYLKEQKPGRIGWNFAKFLIDRKGNVVERFAPTDKPKTLEAAIEAELAK